MKITFFIGNGFDLNLGLKTTYKDFLETYLATPSPNSIILQFKKDISHSKNENDEIYPFWSNAEKAFGEYTKNFSDVDLFSDCHIDFCTELGKYLQEQEARLNFESLEEIIPRLFIKSIKAFTSGFREQQRHQIESLLKDSIKSDIIYNFIDFNYTQTLDKCIAISKSSLQYNTLMGKTSYENVVFSNHLGEILHVHGFADRDMVLGVNDELQIANIGLFEGQGPEYIGEIVKQKTNRLNENYIDEKCEHMLNNSDLIYIYGMSCGETDILWWTRIFKLMQKNGHVQVIIHVYNAPKEEVIRRKYLTFEQKTKEAFVKYSNFKGSLPSTIMERIHITGNNIFLPLCNLVNAEVESSKELTRV